MTQENLQQEDFCLLVMDLKVHNTLWWAALHATPKELIPEEIKVMLRKGLHNCVIPNESAKAVLAWCSNIGSWYDTKPSLVVVDKVDDYSWMLFLENITKGSIKDPVTIIEVGADMLGENTTKGELEWFVLLLNNEVKRDGYIANHLVKASKEKSANPFAKGMPLDIERRFNLCWYKALKIQAQKGSI